MCEFIDWVTFPVTYLLWGISLPAWGPAVPPVLLPQQTDVVPGCHAPRPRGSPPQGHSSTAPALPQALGGAGVPKAPPAPGRTPGTSACLARQTGRRGETAAPRLGLLSVSYFCLFFLNLQVTSPALVSGASCSHGNGTSSGFALTRYKVFY